MWLLSQEKCDIREKDEKDMSSCKAYLKIHPWSSGAHLLLLHLNDDVWTQVPVKVESLGTVYCLLLPMYLHPADIRDLEKGQLIRVHGHIHKLEKRPWGKAECIDLKDLGHGTQRKGRGWRNCRSSWSWRTTLGPTWQHVTVRSGRHFVLNSIYRNPLSPPYNS